MICENCGYDLGEGFGICPSCGEKYADKTSEVKNKKAGRFKFFRKYTLYKVKSSIITSSVIFYVATFVYIGYALKQSDYIFIDAACCLLFGVLINFSQSRVLSIISLFYSVSSLFISCYYFTRIAGYMVIIASILGIYGTFKFKKLWEEYKINPVAYCEKYQKQDI